LLRDVISKAEEVGRNRFLWFDFLE
jgi:hypothetical protein